MNTPDPTPTLPEACPNCAAPVFGPYCAQCGQETVISKLTLREFGHEYIQNFVTLEGRLWRTLWLLICRPGKLTVEFLQGRRRRYVRPLPLYFSISFLLFLVMAIFPTNLVIFDESEAPAKGVRSADTPRGAPVRVTTGPSKGASASAGANQFNADEWPAWLRPLVTRANASAERMQKDPDYGSKRLSASFLPKLPYALFALVPAFAVSTRLVYWRRRRGYAEHFLFALHLHSFVFLTLLAVYWMPAESTPPLVTLGWMAYLVLALHTMFGGRLWPQLLRAMLLLVMHSLVLGGVMIVVLLLSFLSI